MTRKIIIGVLAIIMGASLFYLINYNSEKSDDLGISGNSDAVYNSYATDNPKGAANSNNSKFINILKGKEFSAIVEYEGMIYAGGIQGLFSIEPDTFEYKELKLDNKPYRTVRALYVDNDELWVGHQDGIIIFNAGSHDGLAIANSGLEEKRRINKNNGLKDPRVIDILRIDQDTIFAATFSGIAQIKAENTSQEISFLTRKDYLPGDIIKIMLKESSGGLWLGAYTTRGGGAVYKKGDYIQHFDIKNGLAHNAITTIAETADGKILIGGGVFTQGGANILENIDDKWVITETLKKEDGLAGEKVRNIFVDNLNNIWFCSEYDGVAVFKENGEKIIVSEKDGLSDNEIKKALQDKNDDFWLATRSGINFITNRDFVDIITLR